MIRKSIEAKLEAAGEGKRKLPRLEGMPAVRPRCAWCDKPVTFWTNIERAKRPGGSSTSEVVRRTFHRWRGYPYSGDPIFHSLGCALKFAVACHRAGYRRTR